MVSFIVSMIALVLGYMFYGKIVERVFAPDNRPTPAITRADGVDYIVLPGWKIFMIQFLNIAGTGPVFGAIMGAKFGPSAYLWIVFGCIFAGAVHDYFSGMLSLRNGGAGLPEIIGLYLGRKAKTFILVFSVFLLIMVGAVFIYSPALILGMFCGESVDWVYMWCVIIIVYYFFATMLPIDKIIGKIYPLFAFSMLFMAVALMIVLFIKWPSLPELFTDGLSNKNSAQGSIFPCLFITIACGAISGFHATQSPLMARCVSHEKQGRPLFYGAMITEGVVALIWATVSSYFFYGGAAAELGQPLTLQAPEVVSVVSEGWLGIVGGALALLGVVAAPITSGDTALRSARLIIADFIHLEQHSKHKRFYICIPLFLVTLGLLWFNIADADGFNIIWNYFGWANQTLAVFTLWAITVYLANENKPYIITLIPAVFMTSVCVSFLLVSKNAFGFGDVTGYLSVCISALLSLLLFFTWLARLKRKETGDKG